LPDLVKEIQSLRAEGITVPQIMRQTKLSRASIYRALGPFHQCSGPGYTRRAGIQVGENRANSPSS
jgi:hypothetical protein